MKIRNVIQVLFLTAGLSASAAGFGSSYSSALELEPDVPQTITLMEGTDVDGDPHGDGCCYFKFTLNKWDDCTVWTEGDAEIEELRVNDLGTMRGEWVWNIPWFQPYKDTDGRNWRSFLYTTQWQTNPFSGQVMANSATYYACVLGPKGRRVTVTMSKSIVEEASGTPDRPKAITVDTQLRSVSAELQEDQELYYLKAHLEAGEKYKFGPGDVTNETMVLTFTNGLTVTELPTWSRGPGKKGYFVVPAATADYMFTVSGLRDFTLFYQKVGPREPADHQIAGSFNLKQEPEAELAVRPANRHDLLGEYTDDIIDEDLVKVTLEAGETYAFTTEGAVTNLVLELYDDKGAVLALNRRGEPDDFDCALVYSVPASKTKGATVDVWVGVCQDVAEGFVEREEVDPCQLRIRKIALSEPPETLLVPAPGKPADEVLGRGALSEGHELNLTNHVNRYRIEARKNLTYRLQSVADESEAERLWTLRASVYTLTAQGKRQDVADGLPLADGIRFTATATTTYYVEVSAPDAPGVHYAYSVRSLVCDDAGGGDLGILKVNVFGATAADGASWTLVQDGSSARKYADGDSFVLPAGSWSVKFASAKNWNAPVPNPMPVTIAVHGATNEVNAYYSDAFDVLSDDGKLGDGEPAGKKVTALSPKAVKAGAAVPNVSRSLWHDDVSDWYKVKMTLNAYYNFRIEDSARTGDAVIRVYADKEKKTLVAEGREVDFLFREAKAVDYYVQVTHATDARQDSQYVMSYRMKQVGAIGFAKAAYSVKDNAVSVTIPVNRANGKEGRVRVRYETCANTAVPGTNYYNQSGVIEWPDGNNKTTNLVIRLIPDLVAHWEADRDFSMRLSCIPPTEDDELLPNLGISRTVVTISDAAKKTTGTVQFCGVGGTNAELADLKKPAASVVAGDSLVMWLSRTGGSDGKVAVTVTPTKGKALPEKDYVGTVETIVWDDGDDAPKPYVLRTLAGEDAYAAAKTMTLKLAANKDYPDTVKVGAQATVTISGRMVSRTMEAYSSSFAKTDGITVKAGKADTWYFDESGILRTVTPAKNGKDEITLTLTGPGRLAFTPYFDKELGEEDKSTFTVTIGRENAFEPVSGEEIVRYVPKGSTTVKFTLTRDKNSAGDVIVSFADYGDGQPFAWTPLKAPTLVRPLAAEVSVTARCPDGNDEEVAFAWEGQDDPNVVYLFTIAADKKDLATAKAVIRSRICPDPATTVKVFCSDCGAEEVFVPGELATGKTYYWRVDSTFASGDCTVTNVNTAVWTVLPMECDTAAKVVVASGTDATGAEISTLTPEGSIYPVRLVQGVRADIVLAADLGEHAEETPSFALAKNGGKWPTGLSLKDGKITGIPTKVETNVVVVQVSTVGKNDRGQKVTTAGGTRAFRFMIEPAGIADGTFNGLVATEDTRIVGAPSLMPMEIGRLTATVKAAGTVSAKVDLGGKSYSYSAKSFAAAIPFLPCGLPGVMVVMTNTVSLKPAGATAAEKYPSVLTLTVCRGRDDDPNALSTPLAAELTMPHLTADATKVVTDVLWSGEALRDNSKVALCKSAMEDFVGYYTASLNPCFSAEPETGLTGNGYLTLEVKTGGKVTLGGLLADGTTKPTGSAWGYVFAGADGTSELRVPIYYAKGTVAFGGWLAIIRDIDRNLFLCQDAGGLLWINSDVKSTYAGDHGFRLGLTPVGGFYNTLYNLQAYYLNDRFLVEGVRKADLPIEFTDGRDICIYPGCAPEYLDITGNNVTIDKKNVSGMTFTFKQATGVFSGKFDLYYYTPAKNVKLGSYNHYGVLLMGQKVMTGFYLLPKIKMDGNRTWTATLPFRFIAEDAGIDWGE